MLELRSSEGSHKIFTQSKETTHSRALANATKSHPSTSDSTPAALPLFICCKIEARDVDSKAESNPP